MSILIKGINFPKSCWDCKFCLDYEFLLPYVCAAANKEFENGIEEYAHSRPNWCPLVEVPPHGRLIDADAFIKEINERIEAAIKWGTNAIADRNDEIRLRAEQAVATFCEASLTAKKLPTIIEAEVDDG